MLFCLFVLVLFFVETFDNLLACILMNLNVILFCLFWFYFLWRRLIIYNLFNHRFTARRSTFTCKSVFVSYPMTVNFNSLLSSRDARFLRVA